MGVKDALFMPGVNLCACLDQWISVPVFSLCVSASMDGMKKVTQDLRPQQLQR